MELIRIELRIICLISVGVHVGGLGAPSSSSSRLQLLLEGVLIALARCWLSLELTHELSLMDIGHSTQIQLLLLRLLELLRMLD